jgi:hypothetical protein
MQIYSLKLCSSKKIKASDLFIVLESETKIKLCNKYLFKLQFERS